jgi:hypothetical protein
MSRTRSLFRRRWAARQPGVQATERSRPTSLDTLPRQARVSGGRPCGAHGSRSGAPPTVTPSRVTLQRSAGPALLSILDSARARFEITDVKKGVDRGERAASNSQTLPQRPRQTGLPGPTPFRTPGFLVLVRRAGERCDLPFQGDRSTIKVGPLAKPRRNQIGGRRRESLRWLSMQVAIAGALPTVNPLLEQLSRLECRLPRAAVNNDQPRHEQRR